MLKMLEGKAGYVYYIAVSTTHQRKGIGSLLLRDAVAYLQSRGAAEIYASVGEDNVESNVLFKGHGFRRTNYGEVSRKYGMLKAVGMYRDVRRSRRDRAGAGRSCHLELLRKERSLAPLQRLFRELRQN